LGSLTIIGGLIASSNFIHAQTATVGSLNGGITPVQTAQADSVVSAVAEDQGLPLVSPDQVPRCGTFWTILPGTVGGIAPFPCRPVDPGAPVYQIAAGQFLVDETGGQVPVIPRRLGLQAQTTSSTVASAVTAEADALVNLIAQVQTSAASRQMSAVAGNAMADEAGGVSANFQSQPFTTNDLWLQITGTTNSITANGTAWLVINTPWNVTNGVYDLFSTTNIVPSAWQWVLRCAPGQTNLTVTSLTVPQSFFILGLTNDADGDGLTDAYELLVSHTDPNKSDTSGDGMLDGWKVLWGLNPLIDNTAQTSARLNYGYTPADWLNLVSGIKGGSVTNDAEGNVTQVSQ
jgi:hypothetical protein